MAKAEHKKKGGFSGYPPQHNFTPGKHDQGEDQPGPSGQAQDQDVKRRIGQHTGPGEPPLMKK